LSDFILLLSVAFLVLSERKILGLAQIRKRPNVVRYFGLVQTVFDRVKLLTKQRIFNNKYFYYLYDIIPFIFLILSILGWLLLRSFNSILNFSFGFIFLILISLLIIFPSLWSRWRSNSIFTSIGSIRRVAQICSYDIIFIFLILIFLILNFSFNFNNFSIFILNNIFNIFVLILWILSVLAELNRTPFDLLEGESELVSRFNTEFGSRGFTLLFIREYISLWLLSGFVTILMILGRSFQFYNLILILILTFSTIFIRASYPRIKFNEIIELLWFSLIFIVLILLILIL